MQNSCVVERTCLYDLITLTHTHTHTHTHMIHWQVDPRSRISIPLQVPAKNEARNEWGTCSLQKKCNLPFHSNARSKASACRNIAQLMFGVDCLLFLGVSSCSNSPFLSSMNGNTHKPQLCAISRNVRSLQIFQVCQECHKTGRFSQVTLCKETEHNLLAFGVPENVEINPCANTKMMRTPPRSFFLQYKGIHRKGEKRQLRWFRGMLCAQWIRSTVHRFRAEHERSVWLTAQGECPPPISERQGSGPGTKEEIRPIVSTEGRRLRERYDNIKWFIARSVHCSTGGKVFAWTCTLVLYVFYWERWFARGT